MKADNSSIGSVVAPIKTWDPSRNGQDRTFKYIDIGSVSQETKSITLNGEIKGEDAPSRARQLVECGDVLVSTVRPNLNAVACVTPEADGATASTGFCVLRPQPGRLDSRYLFHWVRTPAFVADMTSKATGQSYPAVSDRIIKESVIPLPPLDEQKRIAAILDQADNLRRLRKSAIERSKVLGQSIFHEMFGDPTANPKGWELKTLGELASNHDGRRVPIKMEDRGKRSGTFPYYGASGIIDYVDDYLFEGPHLLISEDGANLLARSTPVAFIADGRFWVNNHAHVLSSNANAELRYLEAFIEAIDLRRYVTGSAQPKLTQASLNEILVPSPPIELQQKFVLRIQSVEASNRLILSHLRKSDELFLSLQKRAFEGTL